MLKSQNALPQSGLPPGSALRPRRLNMDDDVLLPHRIFGVILVALIFCKVHKHLKYKKNSESGSLTRTRPQPKLGWFQLGSSPDQLIPNSLQWSPKVSFNPPPPPGPHPCQYVDEGAEPVAVWVGPYLVQRGLCDGVVLDPQGLLVIGQGGEDVGQGGAGGGQLVLQHVPVLLLQRAAAQLALDELHHGLQVRVGSCHPQDDGVAVPEPEDHII